MQIKLTTIIWEQPMKITGNRSCFKYSINKLIIYIKVFKVNLLFIELTAGSKKMDFKSIKMTVIFQPL